jgi:hypothetical protein
MNGATAEPSETTINKLSNTRNPTMGVSHHFFRVLRKPQISPNLDILYLLLQQPVVRHGE